MTLKSRPFCAPREFTRLKRVSSWYDPEKDFDHWAIKYAAELIVEMAKGPRVLEMGCASGLITQRLAPRFPSLAVVEAVPEYIAQARRKVSRHPVQFYQSLFENFRPSYGFDDIVMAHILEHVVSPVKLLSRVRGWLATRGRIHIVVPNASSLHRRLGVAMGILKKVSDMSERDHHLGHRRVYTWERLVRHIEAAGLRILFRQGIFLKPLSNAQMDRWDPRIIRALFAVGREMPAYCAEIYVCCGARRPARALRP